ncbi:hypothetical protein [Spiroplasma endosymbiont of Labia minor]|uniref:hypothetical protein n=1 Tax=Spiroplasma endosymbiont of Labia minor TaxID=3066305 RepID=UPI0030CFF3C7
MENKIYNLKENTLGKIEFKDNAFFAKVKIIINNKIIDKNFIYSSLTNGVEIFSNFILNALKSLMNNSELHDFNKHISQWLLKKWGNSDISSIRRKVEGIYSESWKNNVSNEEWINRSEKSLYFTMAYIALFYNNGFLITENKTIEITVSMIKNMIAVNSWEDGKFKE